ncbi:MAG: carbohydrate ABC transporter permease [Alphaproteobacteria bacterium]|jgi:multiple sugar transport system permease protein|nr:carbohydrate ABC transporter permease [Alphaproteobacteria bacterium]
MRLGNVTFMAIAMGLIWGGIWMVLTSLMMMLVTGLIVVPNIGIAALVGAGAALGLLVLAPEMRGRKGLASITGVAAVAVVILTGGQPFSLPLDKALITQIIALIIWSILSVASLALCLQGYVAGSAKRYRVEVLAIRNLKGLGLLLFSVFVALPFYVMVMTSLKSQQSLLANPLDFSIDLSKGMGTLFRSYIELFTDFHFATFLMNSAIVSVITVILTLLFAIPGAYAVARLRFPGQLFLSRSILLIYMVPAIVLVIPLYAIFSQLGLRDSLLGLVVVYPATTIPVALYMLQGYFRGLPAELEEAGLMDGLSRWQVIQKITLPLALPALASVSLYVFMIAWNEFLFAFMFLDDFQMFTLSRGVVSLNSSEVPRQHLMAGSVVATVPVLVIFLWFEKYLVSGLTAGSVKG